MMRDHFSLLSTLTCAITLGACATGIEAPVDQHALLVAPDFAGDSASCASSSDAQACAEAGGFDDVCFGGASMCCFETREGDSLCVDEPSRLEAGASFDGVGTPPEGGGAGSLAEGVGTMAKLVSGPYVGCGKTCYSREVCTVPPWGTWADRICQVVQVCFVSC